MYDAPQIAKLLNISKVTVYAKFKLPEVKPYVVLQNGKSFVDDKGLDIIKEALKYNIAPKEIDTNENELDLLKEDMISSLKDNIEFLKQQLIAKDNQIQDIKQLFENTQVLFKNDQDKNKSILKLTENIKEHDIQLVNSLTKALDRQKENYKMEMEQELLHKKRGFFSRLFRKKGYSVS